MKITNPKELPYRLELDLLVSSLPEKTPIWTILVNNEELNNPKSIVEQSEEQKVYKYIREGTKITQIEVTLFNKGENDTILNSNNEIIRDLFIQIQRIKIDHEDLTPYLNQISHYKNDRGFKNTNGFLGANGTLKIKIHNNLLYTNIVSSLL